MSRVLRTCLGCRSVRNKNELVRFTADSGAPVMDLKGLAKGRGAYICPDAACVREALNKKGTFSKAFRTNVAAPPAEELWAEVKAGLKL